MNATTFQGRKRLTIAVFLLLAAAGLAPPAPAPVVDDDPDERAARRLHLQRSVRENCMICHSDDLITSQRLTPKQWKAEVEKMVGWGSPLPPDQQQPVIEFLTTEYPANAPVAVPPRLSYHEINPSSLKHPTPTKGDPERGEIIYVKNCANCHGPDGQGGDLGPNLVEKPVLWNETGWTEVIRKGQGRMPAFATLIDPAAETDLLAWLRSRRYRPRLPASK